MLQCTPTWHNNYEFKKNQQMKMAIMGLGKWGQVESRVNLEG
jgi:hypothetical protein